MILDIRIEATGPMANSLRPYILTAIGQVLNRFCFGTFKISHTVTYEEQPHPSSAVGPAPDWMPPRTPENDPLDYYGCEEAYKHPQSCLCSTFRPSPQYVVGRECPHCKATPPPRTPPPHVCVGADPYPASDTTDGRTEP